MAPGWGSYGRYERQQCYLGGPCVELQAEARGTSIFFGGTRRSTSALGPPGLRCIALSSIHPRASQWLSAQAGKETEAQFNWDDKEFQIAIMIYMSLIDAHCHPYALRDAEDAVFHARAAGVMQIVAVTEDYDSMEQTLRLRDAFPDFILPGLGIHPVTVSLMSSAQWKTALSFLRNHAREASCIGEIGLDFKVAATERDKEKQREALRAQMEVAAEHRLPVNLHSRRALRQTMEEAIGFRRDTGLPALLHWFAHSGKLLRRTNAEQVFVSVGPSILFSEEALSLALSIDRRLLLIETDAPVPFGGKPASPAWAAEVADRVIASDPDKQLTREILLDNTRRFLRGDGET